MWAHLPIFFDQVGDGQIENGSSAHYGRHAAGVTVVTRTEKMPAPFDQFILSVLSKVGYPISYTNSSSPNKIIVTVPATNGNSLHLFVNGCRVNTSIHACVV